MLNIISTYIMNKIKYSPQKELSLSGKPNKLNKIIEKDINNKDYNSIKPMLEDKQEIILEQQEIKAKKFLPPEPSNKKKDKNNFNLI